jgi:hypothetical protein
MPLLVVVHRWLGVALSLLFVMWFASGIVLMYRTYPAVTPVDHLERAPRLNPALVRLSADEAYGRLAWNEAPAAVRWTSFDGRPAYRFEEGRRAAIVYADDGTVQDPADAAMVDRAATRWAGRGLGEALKSPVTDVDQWTVGGRLRTLRPLYQYTPLRRHHAAWFSVVVWASIAATIAALLGLAS